MRITKKQLKEMSKNTNSRLKKEVLRDMLNEDEPILYLKDLLNHGCQSGMVGKLIYYTDTKKFYLKHIDEIDELKNDLEESLGEPLKIGYPLYNWLALFGYEEMARKIADELGLEI